MGALTLASSSWLWLRASWQCCSFRRQESYLSLRMSNSECSSLHWGRQNSVTNSVWDMALEEDCPEYCTPSPSILPTLLRGFNLPPIYIVYLENVQLYDWLCWIYYILHMAMLKYFFFTLFVVCVHMYVYMHVCMCICMLISQCMCGSQKTTLGVTSGLLPCGSQGFNLGHQVWQQVPLPAEPAYWPQYMQMLLHNFVKVLCKWAY